MPSTKQIYANHVSPTTQERIDAPDEILDDVPYELITPGEESVALVGVSSSVKVAGKLPYGPDTFDNVRYEVMTSTRIEVRCAQTREGIKSAYNIAESIATETSLRSCMETVHKYECVLRDMYPDLFGGNRA